MGELAKKIKLKINKSLLLALGRAGIVILLICTIVYGLIPQCTKFYQQKQELTEKKMIYEDLLLSLKKLPQTEQELKKATEQLFVKEIQSNEDETVCVVIAEIESAANNGLKIDNITPNPIKRSNNYYDNKSFMVGAKGSNIALKNFLTALKAEIPSVTIKNLVINSTNNTSEIEAKIEIGVNILNNHQSIDKNTIQKKEQIQQTVTASKKTREVKTI